ncbi:MAG: trypsin-like peptidase domain-containing protein, partial [Cyclobacteriaceae bacterium]|nr:trypsin-like peptidase domain-containing protein [Cyclobacteriaceae bacterium]
MKKIALYVFLGLSAGFAGSFLYNRLVPLQTQKITEYVDSASLNNVNNVVEYANLSRPIDTSTDFVTASKTSTQSVVYIKNISERNYSMSWMDLFFGGEPGKEIRVSSGSGVIFSEDGYIVTNNHVVEDADKIEVMVNKNTYEATLIGTDPSSDLAVLKIEASNLKAIPLGNSKNVEVGEWVIAVGNPFNLTSTVTAGIVSAKGRQINILQDKFPIESFIQTDAAINPGNSGGALVDTEGKLIGINTAILSRTGSYTGYGFAVPIDIVKKIFHDLVQYGEVQKAFIGGEVDDFNSEIAKRFDMNIKDNDFDGVILSYVQQDGAMGKAGLTEGDIIKSVDGININSRSEFEEMIS